MAELVLNPNSIYKNSQANFILNKDALYTFTRSISAINDSVYGFQPTKQQLISGFDLSDCSDYSLCVVINNLDGNVSAIETNLSALKFFATRPFEVYETVDEMSANAKNPLAVYLVPVSAEATEHYEYIYVLPESISSWEEIEKIYNEGTYLSSLSGEWELVGSTSFTDEKISALTAEILSDVDEKIDAAKEELSDYVSDYVSEVSGNIVADVETKYEDLDEKISTEKSDRVSADEALYEALQEEISGVSAEITSVVNQALNEMADEIEGLSNVYAKIEDVPLSTSQLINDSGFLTEHQSLSDYYTKQETEDYVQSEISDFITEDALTDLATKEEVQEVEDELSNYLPLSGGTMEYNAKVLFEALPENGGRSTKINDEGTKVATTIMSSFPGEDHTQHFGTIDYETSYSGKTITASRNVDNTGKLSINLEFPYDDSKYESTTIATREWVSVEIENIDVTDVLSVLSSEILSIADNHISSELSNLARKEEIPLSTSQLINDSGFISEHQSLSDYYTKQEADGKFLTEHQSLSDYYTKQEVEDKISGFALSNTVAEAYAVSVIEDGLTYTVKQGTETVGTITVLEDKFISAAAFEGTILILSTNTGEIVSTDLSGLAKQYVGDDGSETGISVAVENNIISAVLLEDYFKQSDAEDLSTDILEGLSNEINPKLSTIAECVSAEVQKVDEISGKISAFVSKEDIRNAVESQLSDYEQWLTETPPSISVIINWNRALHNTLKYLIEE